jgi:ubiquinone/menaquinone biosynthesis C-methylase UbiE
MSLWGRIFAAVYDRMGPAADAAGLGEMRRELLADARGRTLELGAGTGLNLAYYPAAVTELVLTEPEEPMARRLERHLAESERAASVVRAPAEALPFADASFDTVVSTLVLCTAADPALALEEVARVLVPGGRLLLLEHVRSDDPTRARWQDRVEPLWRRIGHGCRPNQDTAALLRASALEVRRLDDARLPKAVPVVRPAITAVAVRAAGRPPA